MKYFLIAGEASGDLHAAHLMQEISEQDSQAEFMYLGGNLMQANGGTLVQHYRNMAFMGFIPVVMNLDKIKANFRMAEEALVQFQPDKLILVDYPGFNLKMAKFAKKYLPHTQVVYYISPKLWAWKTYRIKSIKRYVDKMYTIFPFETEFFATYNYHVNYVGNPTYDEVHAALASITSTSDGFKEKNNLSNKPLIALLAGSRKQEVMHCLPRMLEAAQRFSDYQVVVAGAPGLDRTFYDSLVSDVSVLFGQTYELLHHASAAVVNSGTATLEAAIVGTPQVVVYSVFGGRLAYWLKDIFIKTKYVSLVNIIAQKEVVKELLQHLFTTDNICAELAKILQDEVYRKSMLQGYRDLQHNLASEGVGAARNAAQHIVCEN